MLFIIRMHLDFITPRESIIQKQAFITTSVVDHDIGVGQWVLNLRTSLVKIPKINADPDHPILRSDWDDVGHAVRVLLVTNEIRVYQFLDF